MEGLHSMSFRKKWFPKKKNKPDWFLLGAIAVLVIFGFVVLFSASYGYGQTKFDSGYYYVKQQLRGLIAGIVLMFFLYRINYSKINTNKLTLLLYIGSICLLLLCFVPGIGTTDGVNSARRWLRLPIIGSFQPSELAKFALLVVEAAILSRARPNAFKLSWIAPVGVLLVAIPIVLLLYKQPNFSILMITMISYCIVLFVGGLTWQQSCIFLLIGATLAVIGAFGADYRVSRVTSFLRPFDEENITKGSQLRDSLYALGSGGVFGTGLGKSRMKFDFLSYGESDFILAIIGEELGMVGLIFLLLLYFLLIWRGYLISIRATNRFGALTAVGITSLIAVQTFVHILVGIGLIPTTGVTLPFISHGSSSLMCFMGAVGLLLNISCDRRESSVPEQRTTKSEREEA